MSGNSALAHLVPPAGGRGRAALVIHSWWGLTASFRDYADRLAGHGYLAGCVDLYDGKIAATVNQAAALRSAPRRQPAYRQLQLALSELVAHPDATEDAPVVIGFSMGGHRAVWLAQHPSPPVSATVLHYAARGGDFGLAASPFLAHFAERDDFVSASARARMEKAIRRRELRYASYDYPGTSHWFAEAERPEHDPASAELAWDRTLAFLTEVAE